jgi:acyl dehydratase
MKPGDTVPALKRTLGLVSLVGYAAATWDWHGTHFDPEAVTAAGLPRPLVDGQMLGALLAQHALDWAGEGAEVRRMGFRFRSMVFAGDTVLVEGAVESVDGRRVRIAQRIAAGDRVAVEAAWTELEFDGL